MWTHFTGWQPLSIVLGVLAALIFLWRTARGARLRRAAEIQASLSDAVVEEESLPRPPVLQLTGERLDRAREIALAEREILWAVDMLTRCDPEVEAVWVHALKTGEKRLQRLRRPALTSISTAARPLSAVCTSVNRPE